MGYSTLSTKGWDVKAFQAAQAEKDRQIELVLERILQELKKLHTAQATLGRNLPDLLVSGNERGDLDKATYGSFFLTP